MKKKTSRKLFNIAVTTAMATGAIVAAAPSETEASMNFTDLKKTDMFYYSINELVERGILAGFPDGSFRADHSIVRAHAAKIIAGVLGLDTDNVTDPKFTDVPKTSPYYGAIAALENAGIVNGMTDGSFGLNKHLTRGEMAVILTNAFELRAQSSSTPFTDITYSPYKTEIAALYSNKVTSGTSATKFSPKADVTRGQLSAFVIRAEKATEETPVPTPEDPAPAPGTPGTTPENPAPTPGNPTPEIPQTPTPEQVKAAFVNKLTSEIKEANENAAAQNYLAASEPKLEDGKYNIDVTIKAPATTLTDLQAQKSELLPFITENIGLVSSVQLGDGTPITISNENKGKLLLALTEELGIDVLNPNATLGDAAGKDLAVNLWVENGGTSPVPLKLNFK